MKLRCERCGWRGTSDDLPKKYNPDSTAIPELICPMCGSELPESIEVTAGRSVELGYPSGRRVRYLYNDLVSERQLRFEEVKDG